MDLHRTLDLPLLLVSFTVSPLRRAGGNRDTVGERRVVLRLEPLLRRTAHPVPCQCNHLSADSSLSTKVVS